MSAGKKIELCRNKCPNTLEPHFHCPLCRRSCEQLSALTAHLWRCKKRVISVAAKAGSTGCNMDVAKLFSPEVAQSLPHLKDLEEFKVSVGGRGWWEEGVFHKYTVQVNTITLLLVS